MRANLKAFQMQAAQQLFAAAAASLSTAQLGACMWEAAQAPPSHSLRASESRSAS